MAEPQNGTSARIEDLIRVTEQRTRAEERVSNLLQSIEQGQDTLRSEVKALSGQVDTLSRCVSGIQTMVILVAQYMAVVAGQDTSQVQAILQDLLAKSGITFGDSAHVDVGGDMVGGSKEG